MCNISKQMLRILPRILYLQREIKVLGIFQAESSRLVYLNKREHKVTRIISSSIQAIQITTLAPPCLVALELQVDNSIGQMEVDI